MKLIVNRVKSVETTYDLTGLTADQMKVIYHCAGDVNGGESERKYDIEEGTVYDLFSYLYDNGCPR